MPKCARCKNTFPTFLDLKAHACANKMFHKLVENTEKKSYKKQKKRGGPTIIIPSNGDLPAKKQSSLMKYVIVFNHEKNENIFNLEKNKNDTK